MNNVHSHILALAVSAALLVLTASILLLSQLEYINKGPEKQQIRADHGEFRISQEVSAASDSENFTPQSTEEQN